MSPPWLPPTHARPPPGLRRPHHLRRSRLLPPRPLGPPPPSPHRHPADLLRPLPPLRRAALPPRVAPHLRPRAHGLRGRVPPRRLGRYSALARRRGRRPTHFGPPSHRNRRLDRLRAPHPSDARCGAHRAVGR